MKSAHKAYTSEKIVVRFGDDYSLGDLEDDGLITLGRGNVISKPTMKAKPGPYPVYSSSVQGDGQIGQYGEYMFADERITWSVDGGGRFFHRRPHKYSVTNVAGWLKINSCDIYCRYLYFLLTYKRASLVYDYIHKAHPSVIRNEYVGLRFPPLAEQRRIAAKVDAAFEKIDRLKANAEKNLANAKELFQSALDEVMRAKKGWEEKSLGEVGDFKNGLNFKRSKDGFKIPIVGVADFSKTTEITDETALETVEIGIEPSKEWHLRQNDFVFVRSNGSKKLVGRVILIRTNRKLTFSGFCIRMRLHDCAVLPEFLLLQMTSESFRDRLLFCRESSTINNVTQPILSAMKVVLPPIAEQRQVVAKCRIFVDAISRLRLNYQQLIADCAEMRQAVLKEAFEGRL